MPNDKDDEAQQIAGLLEVWSKACFMSGFAFALRVGAIPLGRNIFAETAHNPAGYTLNTFQRWNIDQADFVAAMEHFEHLLAEMVEGGLPQ
jgi:hypothetical protein